MPVVYRGVCTRQRSGIKTVDPDNEYLWHRMTCPVDPYLLVRPVNRSTDNDELRVKAWLLPSIKRYRLDRPKVMQDCRLEIQVSLRHPDERNLCWDCHRQSLAHSLDKPNGFTVMFCPHQQDSENSFRHSRHRTHRLLSSPSRCAIATSASARSAILANFSPHSMSTTAPGSSAISSMPREASSCSVSSR